MTNSITTPTASANVRAWRRFRRSSSAWIGGGLVAVFAFFAATANWLAPHGAEERHRTSAEPAARYAVFAKPSARFWLGTDENAKDVLSRVMHGSRLSLLAGGLSIVLAILVGAPLGIIAGYFGRWIDALLMRSVDVALAFPSILIALLVAMALSPGWTAVILAVGLINVPVFARQVRATVLTIRHLDYVLASRALGATSTHLLWRVVLPGVINPIIVLATLGLGAAILEVAALSFLGVGGDPTEPEWGAMLAQANDDLGTSIWPALGPGLAISLTILGFNLLGDGLRDALDPRT